MSLIFTEHTLTYFYLDISAFIVKLNLTKAFKTNHAKAHKTSSKKPEANKKTSSSTMSDGDIDHKAASGETKIKGTSNLIVITDNEHS